MSRRRQQRRVDKARRHLQPTHDPSRPADRPPAAAPPRIVVREAGCVEQLAYTRRQAAEALGISPSTLRRLLPYLETIELPWGATLIPVDELERLAAERRRAVSARRPKPAPGRKPAVPPALVERIREERAAGKSLREIAAGLNADRIPTAHGASQWWPSTVHAVLARPSA